MVVPVLVLMAMFVNVCMGVLVSVRRIAVGVAVRMAVAMLVSVEMFVFVVALHGELLWLQVAIANQPFLLRIG
jgi:hypothetical protein